METNRPDVHADPIGFFRWFYDEGKIDERGDVEARWHPDLVLIQSSDIPGTAGEFHGYQGLAAVTAELRESFETIAWNPKQAIKLGGGRFLVVLDPAGRGHHGIEIKQQDVGGWLGHLITVHEDGRVVRMEIYLDEDKAREAAGLT